MEPEQFIKRFILGMQDDAENQEQLTESEQRFLELLRDGINAAVNVRDASKSALDLSKTGADMTLVAEVYGTSLDAAIEKLRGVRFRVGAFVEEGRNATSITPGPDNGGA